MATTTLPRAATGYRSGLYEWVTTTDHKKIGILYIVNSFIFFFLGGLLALGIRTELAQPGVQFVPSASAPHRAAAPVAVPTPCARRPVPWQLPTRG